MYRKIYLVIYILFISSLCYGQKYWIFFKDKGVVVESNLTTIKNQLPESVQKRRLKMKQEAAIIDMTDLPLSAPYLQEMEKLQIKPINQSKWLNAISAYLSPEQIDNINKLSFITGVQPVVTYQRREPVTDKRESIQKILVSPDTMALEYGSSFTQNHTIGVTAAHAMGVNATGVLVGMLDTGFNHQEHEAFEKLNVIGEYDFINNDNITRNEDEDGDSPSQHNHGTMVLSLIGGFKEGVLIGPAYGAQYLLAKTEYVPTETQIEEDYWVAGLEWLEQQGAEVVNSSLGYNDWYQYSDMDGNTAVTTRAADIAVQKGVVVVNSAGNEGNKAWRYITAPADGDHVLAVGAVYADGQLTNYSSVGPTYDGRTKPDVLAMGSQVWYALPSKMNGYANSSYGTSFSSPLVAGVAALLLSAHPYLTPFEVQEALKVTASNALTPNNEYGWGIVNAHDALFYYGFFFSNLPQVTTDSIGHRVAVRIFSKHSIEQDSVFAFYSINNDAEAISLKMTASGNANEYLAWIPFQSVNSEVKIYFAAVDEAGDHKKHPYYAPDEYFTFLAYDTTVNPKGKPKVPDDFVLYQNYPNPFNARTKIKYDVLSASDVQLTIYNIQGQFVKTLDDGYRRKGFYETYWDGNDAHGMTVASGVYFYQLKAGNFVKINKMLFLR